MPFRVHSFKYSYHSTINWLRGLTWLMSLTTPTFSKQTGATMWRTLGSEHGVWPFIHDHSEGKLTDSWIESKKINNSGQSSFWHQESKSPLLSGGCSSFSWGCVYFTSLSQLQIRRMRGNLSPNEDISAYYSMMPVSDFHENVPCTVEPTESVCGAAGPVTSRPRMGNTSLAQDGGCAQDVAEELKGKVVISSHFFKSDFNRSWLLDNNLNLIVYLRQK